MIIVSARLGLNLTCKKKQTERVQWLESSSHINRHGMSQHTVRAKWFQFKVKEYMHNCRFHGSSKHTRTSRIFRQTRCEANYTLKPRAYLGTRVRVTQTQLGLLQHAVAQQLHVVGEVEADTTDDFADGLVRAARNRQVLLDGSAQLRINHAQRELTILLALGQVVVQEVLHPQTYTCMGNQVTVCSSKVAIVQLLPHLRANQPTIHAR